MEPISNLLRCRRVIIEAHDGKLWIVPNTPTAAEFQFTFAARPLERSKAHASRRNPVAANARRVATVSTVDWATPAAQSFSDSTCACVFP